MICLASFLICWKLGSLNTYILCSLVSTVIIIAVALILWQSCFALLYTGLFFSVSLCSCFFFFFFTLAVSGLFCFVTVYQLNLMLVCPRYSVMHEWTLTEKPRQAPRPRYTAAELTFNCTKTLDLLLYALSTRPITK